MFNIVIALLFLSDAKLGVIEAQEKLGSAADKSFAQVNLAKALWRDQDQEGAFKVFLEALESGSKPNNSLDENAQVQIAQVSEECGIYEEALTLYLNQPPEEAKNVGKKIIDRYAPLLKTHPKWSRLALIVSLAEANTNQFENFFDHFYPAYQRQSNHFLALKTLAILHIKLFERSKSDVEREKERSLILQLIRKSESLFPGDFSLYRLEIAYAPITVKESVKQEVLNKILSQTMIPPRGDTLYFLKLSQESLDPELTKRWFLRAKEWYPGSRSIQRIEENGT